MKKRRMEKCSDTLYQFGRNVTWILGLAVAGALLIFNLVYNASVAYSISEAVTITYGSLMFVVGAIVLGILSVMALKYIERLKERTLFRFFVILYLIAGVYWILNISTVLRADAAHINNAAKLAAMGDYSFLALGQDIRNHPWQLGMVTYERLLGLFSQNVQLLFLVNLLAILVINYLTWQMADMVFEQDHRTNLLTILFSFCFLPQFFFLAFAYGLLPGFCCMMCGFYFQQKYFREHKKCQLAVAIVAAVLATVLKGNFMVGIIVMVILFIMESLREKKVSYILFAAILFVATQFPEPMLLAAYSHASGYELNSGEPKLLYVAMGILPENRGMAPGWYCGYNDYTYGMAEFDPDTAAEMAKGSIRDSLMHYAEDPADAAEFFSGKIASVWCEPMYQSVWSGPLTEANQIVQTRVLQSLYHGATLENLTAAYMKCYVILLLVLAVFYVARHRKESDVGGYALLYLLGGFLLHIAWEGKSQYVYTYVFILIPCCARALAEDVVGLYKKLEERRSGRMRHERN